MAQSNQRLQSDIHRLLTQLLQRDVDDPQLRMITLTSVDVSRGSYDAIILVHSLVEVDKDDCMSRLKRMTPYFQHALCSALKRRVVPRLRFVWDEGMDKTESLMSVLRSIENKHV